MNLDRVRGLKKNRFEKSFSVLEIIKLEFLKTAVGLTKHITYQYLFEPVSDNLYEKSRACRTHFIYVNGKNDLPQLKKVTFIIWFWGF